MGSCLNWFGRSRHLRSKIGDSEDHGVVEYGHLDEGGRRHLVQ